MDKALVIGASGGVGSALCAELSARHVEVTGLSRREHGLDLRDPATVEACLQEIDAKFDLVFVATGALEIDGHGPEKTIRSIDAEAMMAQFAVNAVGPALILRHVPRLLRRDSRAIAAVLSARVGSIGDNRLGGWVSYRAAKAAVNQIVHTAAIELARTHKHAICVSLHPGTVETEFTRKYLGRHASVGPREAAKNLLGVVDGLCREHNGGFYDWAGKEIVW